MSTLDSASFDERIRQANRFKSRFPNSVPVVSRKEEKCLLPEKLHNQLFLVPRSLAASEFTALIRKKVNLPRTQAMMLFVDGKVLVTADVTISELYDRYHAEDGFLYVICTDHEAFGSNVL